MERIALFDFCGTIANFQTFDPFMEYIIKQRSLIRYCILKNRGFQLICRMLERIMGLYGSHCFLYKMILVRQVKGIREDEMRTYGKSYYETVVRPNLVPETLGFLKECKESGCRIMIVSAGSRLYIEYFAKEFGVEDVISSEIEFRNGICCGRLARDCVGSSKMTILREYMEKHKIQGSLELGVTDSISDKPLLESCRKKVIISHRKHQSWVTDDMEEIIWE